VKRKIFVVTVISKLIFKEVFNNKQDNDKSYERNQNPNNTFIIFLMQFFVLLIGENDNGHEGDKE